MVQFSVLGVLDAKPDRRRGENMSLRFHDYSRVPGFGGGGWGDFEPGFPGDLPDENYSEVVTVDADAPLTRDSAELAAAIKAHSGKLTVSGNDSEMIVALNNRLRFSVTNKGNGMYEITDRLAGNTTLLYGGIAAVALVVVVVLVKG